MDHTASNERPETNEPPPLSLPGVRGRMDREGALRVMERIVSMPPEPDEEELLREFHETTRGFPARDPKGPSSGTA